MRAEDLISMKNKYNSLNSDVSVSSISSVESLLELRREDPEELLLALGFGFVLDEQPIDRIPERFLRSESLAKGVDIEEFRRQNGYDMLSPSSSTSPIESRERSYSCGKISDISKLRYDCIDDRVKPIPLFEMPDITTSAESILNAANRQFLENQGKQEDQTRLGIKRLIIGTKSYNLDVDGDPLALPKTPSPMGSTPVPNGSDNECSDSNEDQIICDIKDNYSNGLKRKSLRRQSCVFDNQSELNKLSKSLSMNDVSSELSSSTATLIETVNSTANELENVDNYETYNSSDISPQRNAYCQTDCDINKSIEKAYIVAIQSLKLSLEFYKQCSLKVMKISTQKYENCSKRSADDMQKISEIHELIENIKHELLDMDTLLSEQFSLLTHSNQSNTAVNQAQLFTRAIKKMTDMLKDQQNIYSRIEVLES